jgi:hypothetical protein
MKASEIAAVLFVIVSSVLIGFFLAAIKHMYHLVAAPRAWKIIIVGQIIDMAMLGYIAWAGIKGEIHETGWEYWVLLGGAIISIIGLMDVWYGYRDVYYGRRKTDYYYDPDRRKRRRRDDPPLRK